jgi:hypothetical protein
MSATLPACIAAGVVLASAGMIVVTPAIPRHPDVEVPAVQLSGAEGLDPIAGWTNEFPGAPIDLETLGTDVLESASLPAVDETPLTMTAPFSDFNIDLHGVFGDQPGP